MDSRRPPGTTNTKRQHYVSQLLLSKFSTDPAGNNKLLGQIDVVTGKTLPARSPRAIGYEPCFVKYDGDRMERLWGTFETPMQPIFDLLDDSSPELLEPHRTVVTDFIALHFARSLEAKKIHKDSLARIEQQNSANRQLQIRLAAMKYGLDLSRAPSILKEMADAVMDPIRDLEEQGVAFQEWVEDVFEKTRHLLSGYSLSIRPSTNGAEFLLGDCPAVGVARGMDPRKRPPLLDAQVILLPLSPRFTAMVFPPEGNGPGVTIDESEPDLIDAMNNAQIAQAHARVYYRPESAHEGTVRKYLGLGQ